MSDYDSSPYDAAFFAEPSVAPKYQSQLVVTKDLTILIEAPIPNAWHRFWTRFFLGWRWEALDE